MDEGVATAEAVLRRAASLRGLAPVGTPGEFSIEKRSASA
jgi:hypothetical protein